MDINREEELRIEKTKQNKLNFAKEEHEKNVKEMQRLKESQMERYTQLQSQIDNERLKLTVERQKALKEQELLQLHQQRLVVEFLKNDKNTEKLINKFEKYHADAEAPIPLRKKMAKTKPNNPRPKSPEVQPPKSPPIQAPEASPPQLIRQNTQPIAIQTEPIIEQPIISPPLPQYTRQTTRVSQISTVDNEIHVMEAMDRIEQIEEES